MVLEHLFDEGTALEALQLMSPGVHVEAQVSQLLRQKDLSVPRKLFMILKLQHKNSSLLARLKKTSHSATKCSRQLDSYDTVHSQQ
jgi:hypothetical protein